MTANRTLSFTSRYRYHSLRAALVHEMSRSIFPANETPVIMQMYSFKRTGSNTVNRFTVVNYNSSMVTIDENPPLAGQNLTFPIRLVSVSKNSV